MDAYQRYTLPREREAARTEISARLREQENTMSKPIRSYEEIRRDTSDTEIITNRFESYPATISRPPARVEGNRVLAWAEITRRDGEYPGGIVLTVRERCQHSGPEYVTWTAYTKDGGETWHAHRGDYAGDPAEAWANFTRRCAESRLAER